MYQHNHAAGAPLRKRSSEYHLSEWFNN